MIDCLAHLDDPRVADPKALLARARAAGVVAIVNAGVDPQTDQATLAIDDNGSVPVHRAFGLHPRNVRPGHLAQQLEALERRLPAAIAIGECGLDRRDGSPVETLQREAFEAQLTLAAQLDLPIILHSVHAAGATLEALRQGAPIRGFWHAFSESTEVAREALDLGLYLSFGGGVCRPKSRKAAEAAVFAPSDRILVESDTPDHAPQPGENSEPASIRQIAERLAKLRGAEPEELAREVETNARSLFRLPAL